MNVTTVLAVWGAVLSTVTFGWNLYRDLLDKPRLKLIANLRRIVPGVAGGTPFAVAPDLPVAGASEMLFVFIDVTNVGRRPVRWEAWGGRYCNRVEGKTASSIVPTNLPKMLTEGESHSQYTEDLHAIIDNVKWLWIKDASGKEWRLPRSELKKLKEQVRKHCK